MATKYGLIHDNENGIFSQCVIDVGLMEGKKWVEDKAVAEASLKNLQRMYPKFTYSLITKAE